MSRRRRGAFSLLEVLFAMSILLGSIAVLGELSRIGTRNARIARDLTTAELLCESKLNEIVAGYEAPEPADSVVFDENPAWLYSVDVEEVPIAQPGLISIRVSVTQDAPRKKRPITYSLARWIRVPSKTAADTGPTELPQSPRMPSAANRRGQ